MPCNQNSETFEHFFDCQFFTMLMSDASWCMRTWLANVDLLGIWAKQRKLRMGPNCNTARACAGRSAFDKLLVTMNVLGCRLFFTVLHAASTPRGASATGQALWAK
jgi:hypothetical protein